MAIDDLIPLADFTYLVVTHIPLQGQGYRILHNFDTATPGSGELINAICDRLTAELRARFRVDKANHSLFEYALTDNTSLSLYASRIDSASADEMGRKGIVHGIYLQQHTDRAAWLSCDRLLSRFGDCFLRIEEEHRRLRELSSGGSDPDLQISHFVNVLRDAVEAFVSSPELLETEGALQTPDRSPITPDPSGSPEPYVFPQRRRFARLWESSNRLW